MSTPDTPFGLIATEGIELLTFGTPNGIKISILLEELKAAYNKPYTYQAIDIIAGNQNQAWYTALVPSGHIPSIVDHDNDSYSVMEGVAIMNYLTHHYDRDHKFSFDRESEACTAEQWISWSHSEIGPYQAQATFFYRFCRMRHAFPAQHFVKKVEKLYRVLDSRLEGRDYIAGAGRGRYSTADIAVWPFANSLGICGIELGDYPNVLKWWERVEAREAVKKGVRVPSGKEFAFGYRLLKEKEKEDAEWVENEKALKEALQRAREEFGG